MSDMSEKNSAKLVIRSIPEESEVNFEEDSTTRRVKSVDNVPVGQHMDVVVEQSFHLRNKSMNDLKLFKSRYFLTDTVERNRSGKIKSVNGYEVTQELGKGAFGIVYKVEKTINDIPTSFAMKVFLENKTTQRKGLRKAPGGGNSNSEGVSILKEIAIMKRLSHPNLVHLEEVIEEKHPPFSIFVIMELLEEGSIMSSTSNPNPQLSPIFRTTLTPTGVFGEAQASKRFRELVSAMAYLHLNHVAHRDLKPDNILMHSDGTLKLADFGVSKYFGDDENRMTDSGIVSDTQGTWPFWSPEICDPDAGENGYSAYAADVWAAGVCLWIFVFGSLPFWDTSPDAIFRKVYLDPLPEFPSRKSPEFEELMWKMLTRDPKNRPKFSDLESFKWITDHSDGISRSNHSSSSCLVVATEEDISKALTPGEVELISDHISKVLKVKLSQVQDKIIARNSLRTKSPTSSRQENYMEQSSASFLMETVPTGGSSMADTRLADALDDSDADDKSDDQNFLSERDDAIRPGAATDTSPARNNATDHNNCCRLS